MGLARTPEVVRELRGDESLHDAVMELERLPLTRACDLLLADGFPVTPLDRMLEALHVGEPAQRDVDRALQFLCVHR